MINHFNSSIRVGVLVATYNGNKFLSEALESLVKQTYSNFEVYVCDDGSDVKPDQIIHSFEPKLKITYIKNTENMGIANTYLKLINQVKLEKDFAIFFAQDDIMSPNYIENIVRSFKKNVVYVYPTLIKVNSKGNRIGKVIPINLEFLYRKFKPAVMLRANYVISPGSALRLNDFDDEMLTDSSNILHDWQMSLFLSLRGKFKIIYGGKIYYRIHSLSTTSTHEYKIDESTEMIANFLNSKSFKTYLESLNFIEKKLFNLILKRSENFLIREYERLVIAKNEDLQKLSKIKRFGIFFDCIVSGFKQIRFFKRTRFLVFEESLRYLVKNSVLFNYRKDI